MTMPAATNGGTVNRTYYCRWMGSCCGRRPSDRWSSPRTSRSCNRASRRNHTPFHRRSCLSRCKLKLKRKKGNYPAAKVAQIVTSAISRAETRRRRVRAAQRSAVHTHAWVERFPIPAQSWCRCKCWGRLLNHYAGFFESLSFKIYCASGNVHGSADHRSAGSDSGAQNKQAPMASDCRTGRGRATGPAWAMSTSVNSAKRAIFPGND